MRTVDDVRRDIAQLTYKIAYMRISSSDMKNYNKYMTYLLDELERVKAEYVKDDILMALKDFKTEVEEIK